jgi:hypothetical protein
MTRLIAACRSNEHRGSGALPAAGWGRAEGYCVNGREASIIVATVLAQRPNIVAPVLSHCSSAV